MYRVERNPEHDASQPDGKELKRNLSAPKGRGVAPASSDDVEIASSVEADVNAMIRSGFVRKVYSILSVQLAVTFGLILAFTYMESIHTAIVAPASCPVLIPPSCYNNASVSQEMCTQMDTDAKETYLADNPKCPKFAASYTCHAIRDSWSNGPGVRTNERAGERGREQAMKSGWRKGGSPTKDAPRCPRCTQSGTHARTHCVLLIVRKLSEARAGGGCGRVLTPGAG